MAKNVKIYLQIGKYIKSKIFAKLSENYIVNELKIDKMQKTFLYWKFNNIKLGTYYCKLILFIIMIINTH